MLLTAFNKPEFDFFPNFLSDFDFVCLSKKQMVLGNIRSEIYLHTYIHFGENKYYVLILPLFKSFPTYTVTRAHMWGLKGCKQNSAYIRI